MMYLPIRTLFRSAISFILTLGAGQGCTEGQVLSILADASIIIERPRAEIFEFIADRNNDVYWREGLTLAEGPDTLTVGAELREQLRVAWRDIERTARVVAVQGAREIVFEKTGAGLPARTHRRLLDQGFHTRIQYRSATEIDARARLLSWLAAWSLENRAARDLVRLKRLLEHGSCLPIHMGERQRPKECQSWDQADGLTRINGPIHAFGNYEGFRDLTTESRQ